jgi:hypothetical protein
MREDKKPFSHWCGVSKKEKYSETSKAVQRLVQGTLIANPIGKNPRDIFAVIKYPGSNEV